MNNLIKSLEDIFTTLYKHPDRSNEISVVLKDTLNKYFPNATCSRVFVSKANDCNPYVVSVIPYMPVGNILETDLLTKYDVDIDLNSFSGVHRNGCFDLCEIVAWFMHELYSNILTDTTLIRYKKLLIKYYDTKNSSIMNTIKSFGLLHRIGIFSRTEKEYINGSDNESVISKILTELGLQNEWNSALAKYVCAMGGSNSIITKEYVDRVDRSQLRSFNELARKYSTYVLHYNNTDYETMIKYIVGATGSELIKFYCEKEPKRIIAFEEKDSFNIFDDRKLVRDTDTEDITYMMEKTSSELYNEFESIKLNYESVDTISDKLLYIVKLKDLYRQVSTKLEFAKEKDDSIEYLSMLKENITAYIDKLKKLDIDESKITMDM